MHPLIGDLPQRFWDKVRIGGPDECWEWRGALRSRYGVIRWGRGSVAAHRLSFAHHHGPIPAGQVVRHRCDNTACVNPGHLHIGTQTDNVRDRVERGRSARGEQHGRAKLSHADIQDIRRRRAAGASGTSLARAYGVTHQNIYTILSGKGWNHVAS